MSLQMPIDVISPRIAAFCEKWRVRELALFGSVLRPDFRGDSDVDVLVAFSPDASPGLLDRVRMAEELSELFGRKIDLVDRRAVEDSPNYLRRREILNSAQVIYGP